MPPRARPIALVLLACVAVAAAACADVTASDGRPVGATPFDAPARYAAWWTATQQCSGLGGSMDGIDWYSVPGSQFVDADGDAATGSFHPRGGAVDRIYVASSFALDGSLVRHEMLHALMARSFKPAGHDRRYYLERCGGVVSCGPVCRQEAGGAALPGNSSPVIPASALELSLALSRRDARADVDSGWVAVTVSARNPHPYPVWVNVPASGGGTGQRGFGIAVEGGGTRSVFVQGTRVGFPAGAKRSYVFELSAKSLPVGVREVRGFHLGVATRPDTLTIVP